MEEIVEMGALRPSSSSTERRRPPSPPALQQPPAPAPAPHVPRSRSSTTILLRSSSRVMPNSDIADEGMPKREQQAGENAGKNEGQEIRGGGEAASKAEPNKLLQQGGGDGGAGGRRGLRLLAVELGAGELASAAAWQSALVEAVGSLILTFVSVAAVIACLKAQFSFPRIAVALTQFLIYTACILATAPASGGHLNPSFSFATMLTGHISATRGALYMVGQSAGAVLGALLVKLVVSQDVSRTYFLGGCLLKQQVVDADLVVSSLGADPGPGMVSEVIFTLLLISVAFPLLLEYSASTHFGDPRLVKGAFFMGLVLGLLIFVSGELLAPGYTSAGMNPARCFGPAIAQGGPALWQPQWVFWLGPFVAGLIFALMYRLLHWRPRLVMRPPIQLALDNEAAHSARMPLLGGAPSNSQPTQPYDVAPSTADHNLVPEPAAASSSVAVVAPRRMDVFLHIKAMMQKEADDPAAVQPAAAREVREEEIVEHPGQQQQHRRLQSFMDLPSTSSGPSTSLLLESSIAPSMP